MTSFTRLPSIPTGAGTFTLRYERRETPVDMRVWTWRPEAWRPDGPVLFVMHGFQRNADGYRDAWAPHAERYGALVVAPEFSRDDFPTPREYEVGNMRNADRTQFLPREQWSYNALEDAFDAVRAMTGATRTRYDVYGHSAGGQFVHRMVTFMPEARIDRAVAANAGAYTVPREDDRYPYALRGFPLSDEQLMAAFTTPMIVLLGENDTVETSKVLLKSPEAMRQGPHRYARGHYYYEAAQQMAKAIGSPFAWRLVTVPGVGHSNGGLAPRAAELLYGEG